MVLHGAPGTGKTHLLESIVNHVAEYSPQALKGVYLSRYNFTHEHLSEGYAYGDSPIVLLDDLFVQYQKLSELHPVTDLRALSYWIKTLYERRVLCVISSNFPFKDGLMPRVESIDQQGRMKSRVAELLRTGFEIEVVGPDGRNDVEAEGLSF